VDEISKEIIDGCVHNDQKCKKIIYEYYYKKMYAICLRYSGNPDEAKDLLQDGFIKMFDKIRQIDSADKFEAWIKRLFTNHCIDYLKSAYKKYIKYEPSLNDNIGYEEFDESENIDFNNPDHFEVSELMDALNKLKPDYRIIINMYAIEKFNHLEIAEKLGISHSTSRSKLLRARNALKALLIKQKR
jgi:RNA polymerase sigma factor (sigma-70 family)